MPKNSTPLPLSIALTGMVAVLAVCGWQPPEASGQTRTGADDARVPVVGPGVHSLALQRANLPAVRYAISVPAEYSADSPVPLVLALHFGGSPIGAGRAVLAILVGPALEELGAVIVAPDSVSGRWDSSENERGVNELLEAVLDSYTIDETRVAVTGFSMGGTGTWHWAGRYPERFSAAIPVAGRPPASAAGWSLPVFAVHSRNDEIAPFTSTRNRIGELRENGVRAELVELDGIGHYETGRHVEGLQQAVPWLREIWR